MIITRRRKMPGPVYNIAKIVHDQLIEHPRTNPMKTLKQTRAFLHAKFAGIPVKESKRLAGIPVTMSTPQIVSRPGAQAIITELVKEEEFQDRGLVNRLKEMWRKKKPIITKDGVMGHMDDTDMWKYSMDRVLELRGYVKNKEIEGTNIEATGGITFNVLQIPNEPTKSGS